MQAIDEPFSDMDGWTQCWQGGGMEGNGDRYVAALQFYYFRNIAFDLGNN